MDVPQHHLFLTVLIEAIIYLPTFKRKEQLGMVVVHVVIPGRPRKEASLGYIVRYYLKNKTKMKIKEQEKGRDIDLHESSIERI
jgi:hypothetical protein